MNFVKGEFEALLALLHRVPTQGIQEAKALLSLAQKLEHNIANWIDPQPAPAPAATTHEVQLNND